MNGKDVSNSSAQSGTTGVLSTNVKKKKHAVLVGGQFIVRECIYKGQFHNTYKGISKLSKMLVMIKMCNQFHDHISNESKIYKLVKEATCIPKLLYYGEEKINGSTYFVRITEQQGPSIKILHSLMRNNFSLQTICVFAISMLNLLEEIHKLNVVHRNIRPRKIVIHNELKNTHLFILDLKNARKYKHKNGQPVRYNENSKILNKVFANKFSSIGTHLGISPSRKDDLESLGYMFIYFFKKGSMFGNKHFKTREEKLKFYEEWKLSFIPETLKSEMPSEFIAFLNYTKAMNILDSPEYDVWRKTFKQLLIKMGASLNDFSYEWIPKIKAEMALQQGANSLLQDLDSTPQEQLSNKHKIQSSNQESQKEISSRLEHDNFGVAAQASQMNVPDEGNHNHNNNSNLQDASNDSKQHQQQQQPQLPPIKLENTQLLKDQEETKELWQKVIPEERYDKGETAESAYYGAVDIDITENTQKQSHLTFGADSETKTNHFLQNSVIINSNRGNSPDTHNINNSNHLHDSITETFGGNNAINNNNNNNTNSLAKKSSVLRSQSLSYNTNSRMNSSTDDLSINDDESIDSLASHYLIHQVSLPLPFNFKIKQVSDTQ